MKMIVNLVMLLVVAALSTQQPYGGLVSKGEEAMVLEFDTTIDTDNSVAMDFAGSVDIIIDWGDGSSDTITEPTKVSHLYSEDGVYQVSITGSAEKFGILEYTFNTLHNLTKVISYGDLGLTTLDAAFSNATELEYIPNQFPESIKNIPLLFTDNNVENLDITTLDLSGIEVIDYMLSNTTTFNQDISNWNLSSVISMVGLFKDADSFNQDIGGWDVSSVTDMSYLFNEAEIFNQNISSWDVSNVKYMTRMFEKATHYNQPLNNWDMSSVIDISFMFSSAQTFNQPLEDWKLNSATNISYIFNSTDQFDQNINSWNVGSVTEFSGIFRGSKAFNQPLDNWDLTSATNMSAMFENSKLFNQDLSSWDLTNVENISNMFAYSESFDQTLSSWDISNITTITGFLTEAELSTENYDETLISWAANENTPEDLIFDGGKSKYSSSAISARSYLINVKNWEISDGGLVTIISEDTHWSGDVVNIDNNVVIEPGVTLTIEEGSSIKFKGSYFIDVKGKISAEGTYENKILFISDYFDGWRGIRFNNSQQESSLLSNCIFNDVRTYQEGNSVISVNGDGSKGINVTIVDVVVEENDIEIDGGGLYINGGNVELINSIFAKNSAGGDGGAIYMENSSTTIINCTIVDNSCGGDGGGISFVDSDAKVYNSIIWYNSANGSSNQVDVEGEQNHPSFYYSNIKGGFDGITGSGSGSNFMGEYENNIDKDPKFSVAKSGYNYTVSENSPCINSGTLDIEGYQIPEYDIIGNGRVFTEFIDMGAFEYISTQLSTDDENIAKSYKLYQNFPNPFNPSTTISFNIPSLTRNDIYLQIFNIKGEMVETLPLTNLKQGINNVKLNMGNYPSGVFFYKLEGAGFNEIRRMVLCR